MADVVKEARTLLEARLQELDQESKQIEAALAGLGPRRRRRRRSASKRATKVSSSGSDARTAKGQGRRAVTGQLRSKATKNPSSRKGRARRSTAKS